jgi:hypothetical protein
MYVIPRSMLYSNSMLPLLATSNTFVNECGARFCRIHPKTVGGVNVMAMMDLMSPPKYRGRGFLGKGGKPR